MEDKRKGSLGSESSKDNWLEMTYSWSRACIIDSSCPPSLKKHSLRNMPHSVFSYSLALYSTRHVISNFLNF